MESASGFWDVYFSSPQDPRSSTYRGGPDSALVDTLDEAQFSIDVAVYHLNLWSVRDALIRADNRGVDVRVVIDDGYADETEIQELERAGIPVLTDQSPNLMHHKFIIVDRLEVWTGSMNLTVNGAYRNDNNLVRIRSREIADNYLREYEEMYIQKRFGASSLSDTPHPSVMVDGTQVETYFSPEDAIEHRIVDLIHNATKTVDLLAFTFTSDPIREALLEAQQRNIEIRGVVEASQTNAAGSDILDLRAWGLDIRLDRNPNLMHHKLIVIDSRIVIFGSYNFTRSAEEKNDENVIIVHDPALAERFLIEFERLYTSARE